MEKRESILLSSFEKKYKNYLIDKDDYILVEIKTEFEGLRNFFHSLIYAEVLKEYCAKSGMNETRIINFMMSFKEILQTYKKLIVEYNDNYFEDETLNNLALSLKEFALKKADELKVEHWKVLSNDDIEKICLAYNDFRDGFNIDTVMISQSKKEQFATAITRLMKKQTTELPTYYLDFVTIMEAYSLLTKNRCRCGVSKFLGYLKGTNSNDLLKDKNVDDIYFGVLREYQRNKIEAMINFLIENNFLASSKGLYPVLTIVRNINDDDLELLNTFTLDKKESLLSEDMQFVGEYICDGAGELLTDVHLYSLLKRLRSKIADELNETATKIFDNKVLTILATLKPSTKEDYLKIHRITEKTFNKYGYKILNEIIDYLTDDIELL